MKITLFGLIKKNKTPAGVNPSAGGLPPETGRFGQEMLKATYIIPTDGDIHADVSSFATTVLLVGDDLGTYLFIAIC